MTGIEAAGGLQLPPHAHLREGTAEYVVELDVSDFTERELTVDVIGRRVLVRGEQAAGAGEHVPFRIEEKLEETFRLPDDADPEHVTVSYRHGTLRIRAPRIELHARRVSIEPDTSLVPRMMRAMARALDGSGSALVVTHGGALRAFLVAARAPGAASRDDFGLPNGVPVQLSIGRALEIESSSVIDAAVER